MQAKTNMLVFSLAAVLALSVVTIGDIPQAVADKDHEKDVDSKKKFLKKFTF